MYETENFYVKIW